MKDKKYYRYFKDVDGFRDHVFIEVLNMFKSKPLHVFEVGCARLPCTRRNSDGWSTFWWAEYVEQYGGKIITCDINPDVKAFWGEFIKEFDDIDAELIIDDAINHIHDGFDLYFLDGAPNFDDMFDQYKKIEIVNSPISKGKRIIVLCDDFGTKGRLLEQYRSPDKIYALNDGNRYGFYELKAES